MESISQKERADISRFVDLPLDDITTYRAIAEAYRTYVPALLDALASAEARIAELDEQISMECGDHS